LINTKHPRRPKAYSNAIGQKKLNAAMAANPDLRDKINKALNKWRARQQVKGGSIVIDNGEPPTRPIAHTVRYITQDLECIALDYNKTTLDNQVKMKMTLDN
jgi:hypothetical protein